MNTIKWMLLAAIIFLCTDLNGQLINIESKRMHTDSIRFALVGGIDFSYTNNDGHEIYNLSNNITSQFKTKDLKKIFLLAANYNVIKSNEEEFTNIWMIHFRANYQISELFRAETFLQTQHDEVLDISRRDLWGIGIRMKLISKDHTSIYWGNALMYEKEESEKFDDVQYNNRHSTYFSLTSKSRDNKMEITNTFYYQPQYNDFSDYRILNELKLSYSILKGLNSHVRYVHYVDSITPDPVHGSQESSNIQFGLGFEF